MRVRDPLLGTRCEVEALAGTTASAEPAEERILSEVERLESIFTVFDESSDLHALRRSGSTDSPELNDVWALARDWHRKTGGAFHPTAQPLVDIWTVSAQLDAVPTAETLAKLVATLDPEGHEHLDFNALAKGWIADRGLDAAFASGGKPDGAWLSLGGDLVHRGEGSVVVGIEDPARPYDNVAPMATIEVSNEALATSGTVHRYCTIDGRRYSRVLDPRTGLPVEHVRQATVVASDAATADVLATAALVLEPSESLELIASENAACLLVTADGEVIESTDRFTRG